MTDRKQPDTWKDLDEIQKELGSGNWSSSKVFEEVGVASEHYMSPSHFWELDEVDRAYLIAYTRTKNLMTAWEHHLATKDAKRKNG